MKPASITTNGSKIRVEFDSRKTRSNNKENITPQPSILLGKL
jgi:hypothetical protein